MIPYELINDLERKLSLYKRAWVPNRINGVEGRDYAEVSRILASAVPYPFELTRKNVKELLTGKRDWPLKSGGYTKISTPFDIERLESLFFIRFVNGRLKVNFSPDPSENYSESVNEFLEAVKFLVDVAWGRGDFERPGITCGGVLDDGLATIYENTACGKRRVNLSSDEIRPVGTNLWIHLLRSQDSPVGALRKWLLLMEAAFEYDYPFDLEFFGDSDRNAFLDASVFLLLEEPDFQGSWKDECRKLFMEGRRSQQTLYGTSIISMNINIGGEAKDSPPHSAQFDAAEIVDVNRLDSLCLHGKEDPGNRLLDIFLWWQQFESGKSYSHVLRSYSFLLGTIFKNEKLIYSNSSFPRLRKVLDASRERLGLAGLIFQQPFPTSLVSCCLSSGQYVPVGLFQVALTEPGPPHRLLVA